MIRIRISDKREYAKNICFEYSGFRIHSFILHPRLKQSNDIRLVSSQPIRKTFPYLWHTLPKVLEILKITGLLIQLPTIIQRK